MSHIMAEPSPAADTATEKALEIAILVTAVRWPTKHTGCSSNSRTPPKPSNLNLKQKY